MKKNGQLETTMMVPLWDAAMGNRLRIARQAMDLDQVHLARDLGITQPTLSKLEAGRSMGSRVRVSIAKWTEVLGAHARYVLTGWGASAYQEDRIRVKYLLKRFNGRQKEPDNKSYVNRRKKRLGIR